MTSKSETLRQKADECERRKAESWERSDTDGFLSQWASGLSANLYRRQADIEEAGGLDEFWGLYEGDRRVKAKRVTFQDRYQPWTTKTMWLIHEDETALQKQRKWVPIGENSRIQKQLGICERMEMAPAEAFMDGRGTGLSGTAWVATKRVGDEWGADATLIEEE
jgi:hypothetical protein